jgi:hypothetical protein
MNLLQAMRDPNLFSPWFKEPQTWSAWRSFLCALFALKMTSDQVETFQRCTGRSSPPTKPASEAWLCCGRRSGKSFCLALIAVFLSCFHDYRKHLAPGERATVMVIARDRAQARVILRYIRALLTEVPMLARLISREVTEGFDLTNSVTIEVASASFKSVRGYSICAALCDELAFWPSSVDSANPDAEIIAALRPAMVTIPNSMLLCASSPYARRGALWDAWRRHYGQDSNVLVWQADTRTMNPTVPQKFIDEAYEADPMSAAAEYGAIFRSDVQALLTRESVEQCVSIDVRERPAITGQHYQAFVDPSGGSADSMTLAIGHRERDGGVVVIDAVRERIPPFSPECTVQEFSELLRSYRIAKVQGDRYAGEWPREQFQKCGIHYETAEKPKSALYQAMLPLINSKKIDLLDHPKLINQLCGLERRTARGGRDSIDHAPGAHDDIANCIAGLAATAGGKYRYPSHTDWISGGPEVDAEAKRAAEAQAFTQARLSAHLLRGSYYGRRY